MRSPAPASPLPVDVVVIAATSTTSGGAAICARRRLGAALMGSDDDQKGRDTHQNTTRKQTHAALCQNGGGRGRASNSFFAFCRWRVARQQRGVVIVVCVLRMIIHPCCAAGAKCSCGCHHRSPHSSCSLLRTTRVQDERRVAESESEAEQTTRCRPRHHNDDLRPRGHCCVPRRGGDPIRGIADRNLLTQTIVGVTNKFSQANDDTPCGGGFCAFGGAWGRARVSNSVASRAGAVARGRRLHAARLSPAPPTKRLQATKRPHIIFRIGYCPIQFAGSSTGSGLCGGGWLTHVVRACRSPGSRPRHLRN